MESNWRRGFGRFLFGRLLPAGVAYPILCGPLRGMRFVLGSAAGEGRGGSVYFNMVEPEQTQEFVQRVSLGQVVFDVGANVGYYSLLGSKCVGPRGKVFAFEPVVRNLVHLYQHISLNKLTNVTIVPVACSDRLTWAVFSLGPNYALGHLADATNQPCESDFETTIVPTVTIDSIVEYSGVYPNVVKIDVEGAELRVLRGAHNTLLNRKPIVLLSVHSVDLRMACETYLKGIGYSCKPLYDLKQEAGEIVAATGQI